MLVFYFRLAGGFGAGLWCSLIYILKTGEKHRPKDSWRCAPESSGEVTDVPGVWDLRFGPRAAVLSWQTYTGRGAPRVGGPLDKKWEGVRSEEGVGLGLPGRWQRSGFRLLWSTFPLCLSLAVSPWDQCAVLTLLPHPERPNRMCGVLLRIKWNHLNNILGWAPGK